ncbi:YaaC family protein [Salibacterium halotolerans]|uniref:YaaC-like Protein n=1 Tax=Salibacterium halotolerans TaxID=1884432 RepID=A0A1I5U5I9_9BACI|nr:YaaC family protein [Salibacterium halotolerans]SFP90522.1 YaaC-like Protein [Salibacterium halotolerans]
MKPTDSSAHFSYYAAFESQNVLQRKLEKEYLVRGASARDALRWSYRNTPVFHYEWLLGRTYWTEGAEVSLLTRPLLLFYGLTHLLKGLLLTEDPHYPAAADMLTHGVTTRKKKKKQFTFLEDEVKIQKQGFFPHFSLYMFHMKHAAGEKWKINHLFFKWDAMVHLYLDIFGEEALPRVQLFSSSITVEHVSSEKEQSLSLIRNQLEQLGIEVEGIKKRTAGTVLFSIKRLPDDAASRLIRRGNSYYMPPSCFDVSNLAPLSIHYLLLYDLSMLCRYEGEWWGDLCTQRVGEDYSFIHYYLDWALTDVPRQFKAFFSSGGSLR